MVFLDSFFWGLEADACLNARLIRVQAILHVCCDGAENMDSAVHLFDLRNHTTWLRAVETESVSLAVGWACVQQSYLMTC